MDILKSLQSNVSMKTKIWGPTAWFFLHSSAMAYPKQINENNKAETQIRDSMNEFLNNFGNILPCPMCGESYNQYIKLDQFNISNALKGRNELFEWTYLLHEKVNDKLGVLTCDRPSFEEVVNTYYQFIAKGGCEATTEEEKKLKTKLGCTDKDFSEYKCIINIQEDTNKEKFGKKKENNCAMNMNNKVKIEENILCNKNILIILLILIIIYLVYKMKMKIN